MMKKWRHNNWHNDAQTKDTQLNWLTCDTKQNNYKHNGMLSVEVLSVVMLSAIMLSVVMLNVVLPKNSILMISSLEVKPVL